MELDDFAMEEFGKSLSAGDQSIYPYLPELLGDLWELGSIVDYPLALIDETGMKAPRIIDLGCGKGSTLIRWAAEHPGTALGVDVQADFISQAQGMARQWGVADRVSFRTEDICRSLEIERGYDLAIYGMDSELLGSITMALNRLRPLIRPRGFIIFETAFCRTGVKVAGSVARNEFMAGLTQSVFSLRREIVWDRDRLRALNQENTRKISARAEGLKQRYPELSALFADYVDAQIEECAVLENEMDIVSILLQEGNR